MHETKPPHLGWIGLDIDGTLTDSSHHIPKAVVDYLEHLHHSGWKIVFITGRIFSFAKFTLKEIRFPHYLAAQNGADIVAMPHAKRIKKQYLSLECIDWIDTCMEEGSEDFIIYGGLDAQDLFYYRTKHFSPPLLDYMKRLSDVAHHKAEMVADFNNMQLKGASLIKCFGNRKELEKISSQIATKISVSQSVIADPFYKGLYLNLITAKGVTKGHVMDVLIEETSLKGPIIGAGNDLNDLPLIERADIGIAIEGAPEALLQAADLIASRPEKCGINEALNEAIKKIEYGRR